MEQLRLDGWFGKTSLERFQATEETTSGAYSKKQSASRSQTHPLCLCLRGGGPGADACTMKWEDGPLLGEFTTRSFGVSPSVERVSRLSQILEDCPHPKYYLSARACLCVLRRAKRRGKKLPEILDATLKLQICRELFQRAAERGKLPASFLARYAARIKFELSGEDAPIYCLDGNVIDRDAKQNGLGVSRDVMYTLNTVDRPAVMAAAFSKGQGEKAHGIGWQEETAPSLKAEVNGNNPPAVLAVTAAGMQCGNPWDPQSERIFTGDGAWHSLSANSSGGQSGDAVLVFDARGNGNGAVVPTITGDHENRITDYTAICVENGQTNNISMAEQANTLDTMHDQQAILCFQNTGRGWWNQSGIDATIRTPRGGDSVKANLVCGDNLVVRRLTPLECERLQGLPDNWTDIGEWTDDKWRKRKTADSNRYLAIGNAIALPFWDWLLRRISATYQEGYAPTLGSLFDGIGSFPLIWSRINGLDAVKWASEIDPFCIAVTKRRFGS